MYDIANGSGRPNVGIFCLLGSLTDMGLGPNTGSVHLNILYRLRKIPSYIKHHVREGIKVPDRELQKLIEFYEQ